MINYIIAYLIIAKLDTETLFNLNQIKQFQNYTDSECNKRFKATFILQNFYRNQVKNILKTKN